MDICSIRRERLAAPGTDIIFAGEGSRQFEAEVQRFRDVSA
jgi:hypothetical protein